MKKSLIMPASLAFMSMCACSSESEKKATGLDISDMDTTVAPAADFYHYAGGGWIKKNPLTAEYARFGSFDQLRETNKEQLKTLIDDVLSKPNQKGTVAQKIADLYRLKMDSTRSNQLGAEPLKEDIAYIDAISDKASLTQAVAKLHREIGVGPFFGVYVGADAKNSSMNIVDFYQGGTNMGDRDYYLLKDDATLKIQDSYRHYITTLFNLAGFDTVRTAQAVKDVMDIETALAAAQFSREQSRIPELNYNKISTDDFFKRFSGLDWKTFFDLMGYASEKEVVIDQMPFMEAMDKLLASTSLPAIKNYMMFNLLDGATSKLSDDFETASFDFYEKTLSGKEEQQPRWKRALSTVNGTLGEAVGELYVEKYFPASSKERVTTLVSNLQKALGEHIQALTWMSDTTKAKALEKLATFHVKIGYPDKWTDYSKMEINKDENLYDNMKKVTLFYYQKMLDEKLGKPVDTNEWLMTPQTVNAYYNPTTNEICFPAAILQPPFFYPESDDAINYGAIGVVIGHEMTHGFDDQGRKFDKEGNMNDWWTASDAEKFTAITNGLAEQYSSIVVLDTVHANGRYTLGENIADQGGLRVSFTAMKNALAEKPQTEKIDGFTPEQRFFLAYARLWAQNIRNAEILRLTKIDPHSLGENRVNAALKNIQAFYDAFGIKEGDAMYLAPEKRTVIW